MLHSPNIVTVHGVFNSRTQNAHKLLTSMIESDQDNSDVEIQQGKLRGAKPYAIFVMNDQDSSMQSAAIEDMMLASPDNFSGKNFTMTVVASEPYQLQFTLQLFKKQKAVAPVYPKLISIARSPCPIIDKEQCKDATVVFGINLHNLLPVVGAAIPHDESAKYYRAIETVSFAAKASTSGLDMNAIVRFLS